VAISNAARGWLRTGERRLTTPVNLRGGATTTTSPNYIVLRMAGTTSLGKI
jgi:hypothetical protein